MIFVISLFLIPLSYAPEEDTLDAKKTEIRTIVAEGETAEAWKRVGDIYIEADRKGVKYLQDLGGFITELPGTEVKLEGLEMARKDIAPKVIGDVVSEVVFGWNRYISEEARAGRLENVDSQKLNITFGGRDIAERLASDNILYSEGNAHRINLDIARVVHWICSGRHWTSQRQADLANRLATAFDMTRSRRGLLGAYQGLSRLIRESTKTALVEKAEQGAAKKGKVKEAKDAKSNFLTPDNVDIEKVREAKTALAQRMSEVVIKGQAGSQSPDSLAKTFVKNAKAVSTEVGLSPAESQYLLSRAASSSIAEGFNPELDLLSEKAKEKIGHSDLFDYGLKARLESGKEVFKARNVEAFAVAYILSEHSKIVNMYGLDYGPQVKGKQTYQQVLDAQLVDFLGERGALSPAAQEGFKLAVENATNPKILGDMAVRLKSEAGVDMLAGANKTRAGNRDAAEIADKILGKDPKGRAARATGSDLVNEKDRERLERIAKKGKTKKDRDAAKAQLKILDTRAAEAGVEKAKRKAKKR